MLIKKKKKKKKEKEEEEEERKKRAQGMMSFPWPLKVINHFHSHYQLTGKFGGEDCFAKTIYKG